MTTINTFPTWEEILPTLLAGAHSNNLESRRPALSELYRMARLADKAIADMAEGNLTWSMDNYPPSWERPVLLALVKAILKRGYLIAVEMEGECMVGPTTSLDDVIKNLAAGDADVLSFGTETGYETGWFSLIYNNGSEHEPMIVISDYSANDVCDEIYKEVIAEVES